MVIYHGSSNIIEKPIWGEGKAYNDYGLGFYCTQHLELAKEWACTEGKDGYVNKYEIDVNKLNILNLSNDGYTILHWLALLMDNRIFRLETNIMKKVVEWLKKNYLVDISEYEMIVGYRADDSYFSFAKAFINNSISYYQLSYAMRLGNLGEQYVLKSQKAFEIMRFVSYDVVDSSIFYSKRKKRDDKARQDYVMNMEKEDKNPLYLIDILREEMKADDPRLR